MATERVDWADLNQKLHAFQARLIGGTFSDYSGVYRVKPLSLCPKEIIPYRIPWLLDDPKSFYGKFFPAGVHRESSSPPPNDEHWKEILVRRFLPDTFIIDAAVELGLEENSRPVESAIECLSAHHTPLTEETRVLLDIAIERLSLLIAGQGTLDLLSTSDFLYEFLFTRHQSASRWMTFEEHRADCLCILPSEAATIVLRGIPEDLIPHRDAWEALTAYPSKDVNVREIYKSADEKQISDFVQRMGPLFYLFLLHPFLPVNGDFLTSADLFPSVIAIRSTNSSAKLIAICYLYLSPPFDDFSLRLREIAECLRQTLDPLVEHITLATHHSASGWHVRLRSLEQYLRNESLRNVLDDPATHDYQDGNLLKLYRACPEFERWARNAHLSFSDTIWTWERIKSAREGFSTFTGFLCHIFEFPFCYASVERPEIESLTLSFNNESCTVSTKEELLISLDQMLGVTKGSAAAPVYFINRKRVTVNEEPLLVQACYILAGGLRPRFDISIGQLEDQCLITIKGEGGIRSDRKPILYYGRTVEKDGKSRENRMAHNFEKSLNALHDMGLSIYQCSLAPLVVGDGDKSLESLVHQEPIWNHLPQTVSYYGFLPKDRRACFRIILKTDI